MNNRIFTNYNDIYFKTLNMQNFGKLKNAFNELLAEGLMTNDVESNKLFKQYIKTIRENKMIKTQFLVFSNIENKVESNREKATEFVKENIALFSKFNKKDMLEANLNLARPILFNQGSESEYINKDLHENIAKLIFTKRSPSTIDTIVEATTAIVDYIISNKAKVVTESMDLPNSIVSKIMVEKYNERYSQLDESEREILKVLIESNDEEKQIVYKKTLKECIELINENLKEADLNAKDKLLQVKEKLLNDTAEVNESYFKNISKLVDLKSSLKNNE